MVLFKRKPVKFLPAPSISDQNADVWVMQMTNEVFPDYESYIRRLDFYRQHDFTCSITGQSGMNFFDAMRSESNESRTVDDRFPEPLKDPVLRKIQFSTISRMEDLVNHIYEEFKQDFFPGEQVTVLIDDGKQYEGIIREKASFPERNDGDVRREAFSRYFVKLHDRPMEEALVNNEHVARSRKVFSKHMLRILLKNSLTREPWAGAPWVLKDNIAKEYKIPTEIPPRLQQGQIKAERSAQLAMRKDEREGTFFEFYADQPRLPTLKPAKGHRGKLSQLEMQQQKHFQLQQYQDALAAAQFQGLPTSLMPNPPHPFSFSYGPNGAYATFAQMAPKQPEMPPPPPPNKGPLEDLDIDPKRNCSARPLLKFWVKPQDIEASNSPTTIYEESGLAMRSIGPVLETWNTLNVLCQPFVLDSFNLDDFVDAMLINPDVSDCELLEEVHCAVLSLLVDENGEVKASLPEMPEDEEDEDSDEEDSAPSTPLPDVPARSTRSSLAKQEAAALAEERRSSPSSKSPKHRAAEMLAERGWVERVAAREFSDGGWQTILVGLLHQLSLQPSLKDDCDAILSHLAPVDQEPTLETARQNYAILDVNLRIAALQMITILTPSTQAIRDYLEECSEEMTQMRKDKIEQQRRKKPFIEELASLDQQRKMLLPENLPDSDTEEAKAEPTDTDVDASEIIKSEENGVVDSEDEEPPTRSLRRNSSRTLDRKRKRDEDNSRKEKESKNRGDGSSTKSSKQTAQFKKLLRDIDARKSAIKACEDTIADLDNDLREANCQRTRPLGRDRFWNRYWWFERNGMPYAGMPDASTAHCGYANARIWVQGPSTDERAGFLNLAKEEAAAYRAKHGLGLAEREDRELGTTRLRDAEEWGYYEDPAEVDALIAWLDERGKREKELRKELQHWRDQIATQMVRMRAHLEERERKRLEAEEEAETGVVTRHGRRDVEKDLDLKRHPCLEWKNGMATREMGKRHAERTEGSGRKKAKKKGVVEVVGKKKKVAEPEPEPTKTKKIETRSTRSGRR